FVIPASRLAAIGFGAANPSDKGHPRGAQSRMLIRRGQRFRLPNLESRMSTVRSLPAVVAAAFALFFFGLGNYLGARQSAANEAQFAALRAELSELRRRESPVPTGTSGYDAASPAEAAARTALVEDVKRQ